MKKFTIVLLVNNKFGVLNRIASLYNRRGFNIEALSVGISEDPRISRMTIISNADDRTRQQVILQLEKLPDVIKVKLLEEQDQVNLESLTMKLVRSDKNDRMVDELKKSYNIMVLGGGRDYMLVSLTASHTQVNEVLKTFEPDEIKELGRTVCLALDNDDAEIRCRTGVAI